MCVLPGAFTFPAACPSHLPCLHIQITPALPLYIHLPGARTCTVFAPARSLDAAPRHSPGQGVLPLSSSTFLLISITTAFRKVPGTKQGLSPEATQGPWTVVWQSRILLERHTPSRRAILLLSIDARETPTRAKRSAACKGEREPNGNAQRRERGHTGSCRQNHLFIFTWRSQSPSMQ